VDDLLVCSRAGWEDTVMTAATPDRWSAEPGPAGRSAATDSILLGAGTRVPRPLDEVLSQAAVNCDRARQLAERADYVLSENRVIRQAVLESWRERQSSPAHRELLRRSALLRLLARLATMPVIEQAKGIIMAQSHCGEREAFGMLRRASQRSNVAVHELATRIVAQAAEPGNDAVAKLTRPTRRTA